MDLFKKFVSVTTALATVVVLSGVLAVAPAYAAASDGVVEDVTGSNPRIAADGESERVFLGLNLISDYAGTDGKVLDNFRVRLSSDDSAAEAAVSNIEKIRVYRDSSLAGTNGVFDENDPLSVELSRTDSSGQTTTLAAQTATSAFNPTGNESSDADKAVCLLDADAGNLSVG
ncbi:MAG: hypothetical protein R3346_04365, partial [Candidatus Spechtbacterales bacterium]|nr:hypothetical protein [Candidatus Spechtbacterales bacterium]